MKKLMLILCLVNISNLALAQETRYYKNDNGKKHLCGPFEIQILENDSTYQKWFNSGYNEFTISTQKPKWIKNQADIKVEIYLGTWCGDSKNLVPKFVKMWDQLGLDRKNLKFIALYDMIEIEGESKYKQSPNGEEKGKGIHRVPTFIFNKDGKEIARMVEYPVNDLETDLAQIAIGYPSKPNYKGASYMIELFSKKTLDEIKANETEHFNAVYRLIKGNPSELNSLGYVLLESGRMKEALLTFYFNTRYFQYEPNVYDSYAEALAKDGQITKAIETYEKVLLLDRSNANATKQIKILKEK